MACNLLVYALCCLMPLSTILQYIVAVIYLNRNMNQTTYYMYKEKLFGKKLMNNGTNYICICTLHPNIPVTIIKKQPIIVINLKLTNGKPTSHLMKWTLFHKRTLTSGR